MSEPQGTPFGPFRLLSELGRGGMGTVHRAWDPAARREVALKLVQAGVPTATALERFRREGEVGARLEHPGIVRVHAAGEVEGKPYLACELVPGAVDLETAFAKRDLSQRVELVRDAARALGYAHAQGVVHRDVKPENVLVSTDGQVKLTDFGLVVARDMERLTRTGAFVGTATHLAPEAIQGKDGADPAPTHDVWSLGVLLYQALTGQLPFEGNSLPELVGRIVSMEPLAPRLVDADVPAVLEAECLRALSKDPADRHTDGEALAERLDALLERQDTWRSSHTGVLLLRARSWLPTILGAVVLTAALGTLAWVVASGGPARPKPTTGQESTPDADGPSRAVDAGAELASLRQRLIGSELALAVDDWLARNPSHPDARAAQRILQRTRLRRFQRDVLRGAAFLSDERIVLRTARTVEVFDLARHEPVHVIPLRQSTHYQTVATHGERFAYTFGRGGSGRSTSGTLIVVDGQGEPRTLGKVPGLPYALAWSPDGKTIAVGGAYEGVYLFDPDGGQPRVISARDYVRALAFTADSQRLLAGSGDAGRVVAHVELWSLTDDALLTTAELVEKVNALTLSPDETQVFASDNQGSVLMLPFPALDSLTPLESTIGGSKQRFSRAHQGKVESMTCDRLHGRLLTVSSASPRPSELIAWSLRDLQPLGAWRTPDENCYLIAVSPSGRRMLRITGSPKPPYPGALEVWSVERLRRLD